MQRLSPLSFLLFQNNLVLDTYVKTRGGYTPLCGLYGDVPLDRVWFLASLSYTGYKILCVLVYFVICSKLGPKMKTVVLNRVGVLGPLFVLNSIRDSNPQRHPYRQTWVQCPPPLPPGRGCKE